MPYIEDKCSHTKRITAFVGVFAYVLCSFVHASTAGSSYVQFQGNAYDLDTGEPVYIEKHQLLYVNDKLSTRHVKYYDPNNLLIAEKFNDYKTGQITPNVKLQDFRNQYSEEASYKKNHWLLEKTDNNEQFSKKLSNSDYQAVIDAGFDQLVLNNWERLLDGKSVNFSFAATARMDWVNFKLIPQQITDETLVLKMKLKSRWVSWLVNPIILTYDRKHQHLVSYKGLTNIRDKNGRGIKAEIRYQYETD